MRKDLWVGIVFFLIIPGLLLTASCAKRQVESQPEFTEPAEMAPMEEDTITSEEEARLRKLEEQRIEEQRLEEQRHRALSEHQKFINQDIHFDFDKFFIRSDAQDILEQKAEYMRQNPEISVIIEGHCDERGTDEYNIALGERRAESAKQFMMRLGISDSRMVTISYGEERPVDPGHNEEAWAKNRRAHFVIQ